MDCPDADDLAAFGQGRCSSAERARIEAHLDVCDSCCRVASELARVFLDGGDDEDEEGVTLQDGSLEPEKDEDDGRLPPGSRLDRYHILEQVGEGAMGVVYAAYDPDLDRKVALKVLRNSKGRSEKRSMQRLLREAQAMARLSHPNVIVVHEARVVQDRLFISMEFVDGCTLKEWLARDKPDWTVILELFRDVVRAIAAAHAAGLIHRDVKPDNILVGNDARVRVTDFGLARPTSQDSGEVADTNPRTESLSNPSRRPALAASLTRQGALVGTPAYMAPEQLTGRVAIEASDQFSVCVAMYEALHGQRPFAGTSLPELSRNVLEGRLREPDKDSSVPRWLRQVVLRGLSTNPHDRWPSMDALLTALSREPARLRKRWVYAGLGGVILITVASMASMRLPSTSPACDYGSHGAAHLWSKEAKRRIVSALTDAGLPYGEDTAAHVTTRLDNYTRDWEGMFEDACLAHHRGEQSDRFFDMRMACLDERRRELRALLHVLSDADGEVVRNAVDTVDGLRGIDPCANLEALSARVPPPEDPRVQGEVAGIEADLARVQVLRRAGRYAEALELARSSTAMARTSSYEPILAKSLLVQAHVERLMLSQEDANEHGREAWQVALRTGDDQLAAEALILLVETLGHGLRRHEEAESRAGDAASMIERVARQDEAAARLLESNLHFTRGQNWLRAQRPAEAIELFEQALRIHTDELGGESLQTANMLNALGTATQAQFDYAGALAYYQQALRVRQRYLGDHHPEIAGLRNNIGLMLKHVGRLDEAYDSLTRSLHTLEAALGKDHGLSSMARLNLAEVCFILEKKEEAAYHYAGVFGEEAIRGKAEPTDFDRIGHYAATLRDTGRHGDALRIRRELLEVVRERGDGRALRHQLGEMLPLEIETAEADDWNRVIAMAEELVALERGRETNADTFVAEAEVLLARALMGRGRPEDRARARQLEARAQAILRNAGVTPAAAAN